ncbi:divalent metal cation transporter, partial [Bifidobacterium bifidum]
MAERDEGATGSQSAMVSGEPVVDIDTVAEAAVADQDVAIARKDSGKPEKPIHA